MPRKNRQAVRRRDTVGDTRGPVTPVQDQTLYALAVRRRDITVDDTRGLVTPVQNQSLYTLALILRLLYLLLNQFFRVRRDRTIRGT